jgi:hypothetical protein
MRPVLYSNPHGLHLQVTLGTPLGHEVVELPEEEVTIVSTNEAQRQLAISKAIEDGMMPQPGRSKSSTRHAQNGLSETTSAGSVAHETHPKAHDQSRTVPALATTSSPPPILRSSSRRPHTSAGPRDKPKALTDQAHAHTHQPSEADSRRKSAINGLLSITPDTIGEPLRKPTTAKSSFTQSLKWKAGPTRGTPQAPPSSKRTESSSSDTTNSSVDSPKTPLSAHILAWEEELMRIEAESRRSSARMFGILGKPQRQTDGQRAPLRDVSWR